MLALIVLILVLIDIIILIIYTAVVSSGNSDQLDAKIIMNEEYPQDVEGVCYGYNLFS